MRLLRIEELGSFGGTYSLDEYIGKNIPPYAVLSHTWGPDSDEVSFKDVRKGKGKSKAGYQKIHFCAKQAAADGLQHFWVDTCCIDKSSSAELTEAINSMFRWYQHSTKCYVYLADVSVKGLGANDLSRAMTWQTWRAAFQRSRWFTRGWTLQELLAPISVVFFSAEGEKLGDKHSLLQEIHDTSHVPPEALQGRPLHKFSTGERMLWAAKRETKREEDAAYSLLGIFDIQIPLIYGEGREKAFMRLQRELERESAFARSQSINGARLHNHFLPPSNDAWAVGETSTESQTITSGDDRREAPHQPEWSEQKSELADTAVSQEEAVKMKMWWDDAIARNMNLSQGYTKVAVLLIKWLDQLDEGGTRKQLVELEVLFRERFRFLTKTVELSISTKPQHQLDRYLSAFIDQHDGSDTLLIVCYTGYSIYHEDHEYLELTGKFRGSTGTALNDGARANWSKTEAVLRSDEIEGDVLVLLNTPYGSKLASTAERSVWRDSTRSKKDRAKKFEVLSACAIGSPKALPREGMFTQILTSALNEATAELHNASFTTFQLNQRMLLRPGTSNPQSVLWANLSHDQGYIRIAPLKVEKDRQGTRTPRPPRGYLTLRFALRNATLSEERIEYLAQALTRATSDKALVGVRRIDWLRFQPARSTLLDQAGLAKFAIARWKFFVKRRQQKRDSKTKTGEI